LPLLVAIFGCWHLVAEGNLFTFADGPPCPEHNRRAVTDLVHVGVAAVVHQTEGQQQTRAQLHFWHAHGWGIVVGLIGLNDSAVDVNRMIELQEYGTHQQPEIRRDLEKPAENEDDLK
jgi:hypothetical protein